MLISAGFPNEPVAFNWDIIDHCQFECSYCYNREFNDQKTVLTTAATAYKLVLARLRMIDEDWRIDIQGGEPTLHPKLHSIVDELSDMDNCKSITIATNLTKPFEYYQRLLDCGKVSIHMSYHPEYHTGWNNRIVKYAYALGARFFVEVILHPDEQFANATRRQIDALTAANVRFGITLLHSTDWFTPMYSDELLRDFADVINKDDTATKIPHEFHDGIVDFGEHEIYNSNISYKGMYCDARMFTIGADGTIINTCTRQRQPLQLTRDVLHNRVTCPIMKCECSQMLRYRKDETT